MSLGSQQRVSGDSRSVVPGISAAFFKSIHNAYSDDNRRDPGYPQQSSGMDFQGEMH